MRSKATVGVFWECERAYAGQQAVSSAGTAFWLEPRILANEQFSRLLAQEVNVEWISNGRSVGQLASRTSEFWSIGGRTSSRYEVMQRNRSLLRDT